jgi:preprotein translocase subunit SecD
MRRKLIFSLVGILVVAYGSLIAVVATGTEPALGLDLQGGISVTQRAQPPFSEESLDLAVEKIRERIDSLGVAEPEILRQGDTIVVNLPGVKNQRQAEELVKVTGQVYLRPVMQECLDFGNANATDDTTVDTGTGDTTVETATVDTTVDTASSTSASGGPARSPSSTNTTTTDAGTTTTVDETTTTTGVTTTTAPGETTTTTGESTTTTEPVLDENGFPLQVSDPYGQQYLQKKGTTIYCLVGAAWNPDGVDPVEGSGEVFDDNAAAAVLQTGWGVTVDLREGSRGRDVWNAIASACYYRTEACPLGRLAIELDGIIQSDPQMNEPSFSGGVEISGNFSEGEARNLARVLNSGSLPVRLTVESTDTVSATLGKDSLRAAWVSGLVGVGLVLIFMVLYYRMLGFIVAVGVTVSASLMWSVISVLSRTQGLALSLSGIAGIVVSVGVTVDSYVVFFERLKDEVRSGKSLRNSAQRGFTAAWHTIVIADLVSLIGAFVLWYLTVGAVRGFAFFLGLSTACDLLVSYTFTRPTVLLLARTSWMERRKVMGVEVSTAGGAA